MGQQFLSTSIGQGDLFVDRLLPTASFSGVYKFAQLALNPTAEQIVKLKNTWVALSQAFA